jgi:hypothetical protein
VDAPLIKALLTAALYPQARVWFYCVCVRAHAHAACMRFLLTFAGRPQVMTVTYPAKKGGKAVKAESLKFHIREDNSQVVEVAIHPSSVNAKARAKPEASAQRVVADPRFCAGGAIRQSIPRVPREGACRVCAQRRSPDLTSSLLRCLQVRTTRIYIRDCSTVSPYALMLFGGALSSERGASKPSAGGRRGAAPAAADTLLTVDGWIKFRCVCAACLVSCAR